MQRFKEFILSIPVVYDFVQWVFDSERGWGEIVAHVGARDGDRVLDIGCGTANILKYFPEVVYFGYDMNEQYLAKAREAFADKNAEFHCGVVSKIDMSETLTGKCDIVLAKGVLHHLDDGEVQALFEMADAALKPGGRFISIDPVFLDRQRLIARYFVGADRGRFVRHWKEYEGLYRGLFDGETKFHLTNLSRFPLDEIVCVARKG